MVTSYSRNTKLIQVSFKSRRQLARSDFGVQINYKPELNLREILRSPRIQGSSADTSRIIKRYDCGLSFPIKRSSRFNHIVSIIYILGFPDGLDDKESTCIAGELSLIPGSGRSPGEGNGYSVVHLSIFLPHHVRSQFLDQD